MATQQKLRTRVPSVTILATTTTTVGEVDQAGRVTSVSYVPDAAITGANSPASRTFTLVNKGQAGAGSTNIATLAMVSGVDGVANDEKAITLNATASNLVVAATDILVWVSTAVGGTGLVDPGGLVQVEIGASSYTDVGTGTQVAQSES